jgi:type 1 fimbria pilin
MNSHNRTLRLSHSDAKAETAMKSTAATWTIRRGAPLAGVTLGLALGLLRTAQAATCEYVNGTSAVQAISNLTGAITVGRDVPVGSEIYRATFNATSTPAIHCTAGMNQHQRRYTRNPYPLSSYVHPQWGPVYRTSNPGIGVVLWNAGSGLPVLDPPGFPTVGITYTYSNGTAAMDMSLIKIGDVTPGTITPADLPNFEYALIAENTTQITNGGYAGSLNIVSQTCRTPDVNVDLGKHKLAELNGIGTTTQPWVDVPIVLSDCPPFHAAFKRDQTIGGATFTNSVRANQINYTLTPVNGAIAGGQGVIALTPGADTAVGIGVQIATRDEVPVSFSVKRPSGLTLGTGTNSYTIPLRARYYQTLSTTTPGKANAAVTVTLEYL